MATVKTNFDFKTLPNLKSSNIGIMVTALLSKVIQNWQSSSHRFPWLISKRSLSFHLTFEFHWDI